MDASSASTWRTPRAATAALRRRLPVAAVLLLAAVALAACDDASWRIGTGPDRDRLVSGSYDYRARSDRWGDTAWWGYVDLRVDVSGRITGSYRLPRQCSDRFGPGVDCVGYIGGRVYRDGTVRFGFDEGWLSHEGHVSRRSDVTGRWWTRIVGHHDEGRFDLFLY